jgi:hypothetical protein
MSLTSMGRIAFVILLPLLLVLLSLHEGLIIINLHALKSVIWPIVRFAVNILMTVLLSSVLVQLRQPGGRKFN